MSAAAVVGQEMRRGSTASSLVCALAALLRACGDGSPALAETTYWGATRPVEVAKGNARQGAWKMNESDYDYVDDPTVAVADDGHIGVAWVDQARQTVLFQMYTPDGRRRFSQPMEVPSRPGTFSWLPKLVIAPDEQQRLYLLWEEIVFSGGSHGGEIYFSRSSDGGATFDPFINLSNSPAGDGKGRLTAKRWDNGSLDLAAGPNGQIYAAWTEYEGRLWVSRSTDGGDTFDEPIHVAGDADQPARAPALEVGAGGVVHLAWSMADHAAPGIRITKSLDRARSFEAPQIVESSGHADGPRLAADAEGTLHLVYGYARDGIPGRYEIRYTKRNSGTERFTQSKIIARAGGAIDSVNFPELAVDGTDRLYVIWQLFPERRQRSRGLGFTLSLDGGHSFRKAEAVPESDNPELGFNGSLQGSLVARLAVNADGSLALVNSTFAPGRFSQIWLWRRSSPAR
jgi:hypothetical protein